MKIELGEVSKVFQQKWGGFGFASKTIFPTKTQTTGKAGMPSVLKEMEIN